MSHSLPTATTDTAANAFGSLAIRGVDAMQRLANGIETPAARIVEVVGSMAAAINAVSGQIGSGDTIVVPLDAERMRPLPLWTAVTTIIFNLAVAVAAVAGI